MAPGQGTGFVSVGDYLDANRGTLANEGAQIGSGVGQQIDAARGAADDFWKTAGPVSPVSLGGESQNIFHQLGLAPAPTNDFTTKPGYQDALDKAIAAKDDTTALGSEGGLSDYFQKHFGDTASQGSFDASLLGSGFGLSGLQTRASGLTDYLNTPQVAKPPPAAPLPPEGQPHNPDDAIPPGWGETHSAPYSGRHVPQPYPQNAPPPRYAPQRGMVP